MSIKFSDNKIFGENFISNKKNIHCSIGFLIIHKILTNNGTIVPDRLQSINKSFIWQYIYYLRMHNKKHPFFKDHVGQGSVTPKRWYNMMIQVLGEEKSKRVNTVTKNDLYNFIFKLFNSDQKVSVPFYETMKSATELINDFNSQTTQKDELKIMPNVTRNVKLVANGNVEVGGPNIKISINTNLDNIQVNNSNIKPQGNNNSQIKIQNTQVRQTNSLQNQLNTQTKPQGQTQVQSQSQIDLSPNTQVKAQNTQVKAQNTQVKPQNTQVKSQNTQVKQQVKLQEQQVKLPEIPIAPM
jgi:hypothetical protein